MESLGLSLKGNSLGINGERELRGQPAKPGSPRKMAIKTECVCVCVYCVCTVLHTNVDRCRWFTSHCPSPKLFPKPSYFPSNRTKPVKSVLR